MARKPRAPVTAKKPRVSLFDTYRRKGRGGRDHPHLVPVNAATFTADRTLVLGAANRLLGYQAYLAAARATKASRKRVSMAFERSVLTQARQAQADLDALAGAALRLAQQVNHTNLWSQTLTRMTESLRETGPVDVKAAWADIVRDSQLTSVLAHHGLTGEVADAVTDAMAKVDARLVSRDGKVSVETRVAGERTPRRLSLRAAAGRPTTIGDLLRRSQFERVVSAITNNAPVYVDTLPAGGITEYEPADLVAFGAVAARQRFAEHVRKLEDTGLATYQGEDPLTVFATVLVIALFLGVTGWAILEACEGDEVTPPDWACTAGAVLVVISVGLLALCVLALFAEGVFVGIIAAPAFIYLLSVLIENAERLAPGFSAPLSPSPTQ